MNRGEIWQLGQHKLMCGDCTNPEDISKLMQGHQAKILFTSPPYSDIRTYKGHDVAPEHIAAFIPNVKNFCNILCVNLGIKRKDYEVMTYWDTYIETAKNCGLKLLSWNVWDKLNPGNISQQTAMFPIRHEFIFVFGKAPCKLNLTIPKHGRRDSRPYRRIRDADGNISITTANPHADEDYKQLETVIACNPEKTRPVWGVAQMPLKLPFEYINALTCKGDIVIDCFGGSGTTLIACEGTGRTCYMMEISEEYCDTIIKRWESILPMLKAEKIT